jgi:hypothetical protein
MRDAFYLSLLCGALLASPALAEPAQPVACFVQSVAPLRSGQLERAISDCTKIIDDRTARPERRGQALAQRGLMYARLWSLLSTPSHAFQGITDLTEALELHKPAMERRHLLLIIRAQLYAATGQTRWAQDDYGAILNEDPTNRSARDAQKRLGPVENY